MNDQQQKLLLPDERVETDGTDSKSSPSGLQFGEQTWPEELTRRLRVILHTVPFNTLRRSDALHDEDLRHYDSLALALRLIDIVIDRLGLEDEADRDVVRRALEPVLVSMDEAANLPPSSERHERMVDRVLANLRNDSDARRPFREEYTSLDANNKSNRHIIEFRLISDAFHPSGKTVLRPSNEVCNLYLRLLDIDIEDEQAAAEAVVESQLARGRFDEAVYSARQARIQSIRFREKVLQIIRDTRRDVDRVDWRVQAPHMLEEAREHLARRLRVEQGILNSADERLQVMSEEDAAGNRAVSKVAQLVRDCQLRHVELHEQLMRARNVFLDSQALQSFVVTPTRPLPNLLDDVLEPLLRLPVSDVESVSRLGVPLMVGPRSPNILSLSTIIPWMLQPRRPQPFQEIPINSLDPTALSVELMRYPPEVREEAKQIIMKLDSPIEFSTILDLARSAGASTPALEVLVILTLQGFAAEDHSITGISAECLPGSKLVDPLFYGDDLLVQQSGGDEP